MQDKNNTWTEKYKPKKITELTTNTTAVKSLYAWLSSYHKCKQLVMANQKGKKKNKTTTKTGTNDQIKKNPNIKSCALVTGGHGVGKSVTVEVILKELNYDIQIVDNALLKSCKNASDIISKIMTNTNILNMMNNLENKKTAILVDEIESISSSADKGCILTLQKLNDQHWYCPIIFISNNHHNKLLSDIKKASLEIKFWAPYPGDMKKILNKITINEGIKLKNEAVINKIINHSQSDIRGLIFILQELKYIHGHKLIDGEMMDEYCQNSNKKDIDIDLYKATDELLYQYENVDNCLRLYETEKVLSPLMIHQNYIKSVIANTEDIADQHEQVETIAELLALGDVIENYIYGDQNWELQIIHGFFSCVAPSYYLCKDLDDMPNKVKLTFATDLNKTSIKRINKENIINTDRCFKDMNINDYIYVNKIIRKLLADGNIKECINLLKDYNIKLEHIESLLKIDKIKDTKTNLTSKQKSEFNSYL